MNDLIDRQQAIDALKTVAGVGNRALDKLRQLQSAQPESQWIPCSERLPDKNGRYWVWAEKFVVPDHTDEPATYQGSTEANFLDGRWFGNIGKVYAWMPLPKPYKGGADMAEREGE